MRCTFFRIRFILLVVRSSRYRTFCLQPQHCDGGTVRFTCDRLSILEMLESMDSNLFHELLDVWCDRTIISIDCNPVATGCVDYYFYYDPLRREKIYRQAALSRSNATVVLPDDLLTGGILDDEDVERTPFDTSRDADAYTYGNVAPSPPA